MTYLKRERDTSGITARGVVVVLGETSAAAVGGAIITEASDIITTEGGDSLVVE